MKKNQDPTNYETYPKMFKNPILYEILSHWRELGCVFR